MKEQPIVWNIDDDDISKFVMKRNLNKLGVLNIIDFPDSIEPLEILTKNFNNNEVLPDIIFLDLNMPILNGFEFMEDFKILNKKITKEIQIFMLTSSLNDKDIERAKAFPEISDYFIKPIKQYDLSMIVDKMLQD